MKVVNDHAYIVSEAEGHGMQVFDLRQLRGLAGVGPENMRVFENTAHMDNFGQAHNIASNPAAERVYVIGSVYESGDGVCTGGESFGISGSIFFNVFFYFEDMFLFL